MIQNSVEASRSASLRLRPCCSRSVNTGTNAADSAAFANRLRDEVRDLEGDRERRRRARSCRRSSRRRFRAPARRRARRRWRSRRSRCCAPSRRPARRPAPGPGGSSAKASAARGQGRYSTALRGAPGASRARRAAFIHGQHPLPEEADPALRARAPGEPPLHLDDQDLLPPPARRWSRAATPRPPPTPPTASSSSTIDKAVKRGALHRNTGARKKSRAARIRAGAPASAASSGLASSDGDRFDRAQRERVLARAPRAAVRLRAERRAAARVELEVGEHRQRRAQPLGVGARRRPR